MDAFVIQCSMGNLAEARKLYLIETINLYTLELAFRTSCCNGHIEVAKWLYLFCNFNKHIKNRKYNRLPMPNRLIDIYFQMMCGCGQIDVAKWLCEIGANIHEDNDHAFFMSCQHGKIEIAKWLYSLENINIHANNNNIFKYCCLNGKFETIKWLCEICPDYHIEINNGKIINYWIDNDNEELIKNKQYDALTSKCNYKTTINNETCMICYENIHKKIIINCKHDFCISCLCEWKFVNKHNECPYCRQNIDFIKN